MTREMNTEPEPTRSAAADWPGHIQRCRMSEDQADFCRAMWYLVGAAWVLGVPDQALRAVCNVVRQATEKPV